MTKESSKSAGGWLERRSYASARYPGRRCRRHSWREIAVKSVVVGIERPRGAGAEGGKKVKSLQVLSEEKKMKDETQTPFGRMDRSVRPWNLLGSNRRTA